MMQPVCYLWACVMLRARYINTHTHILVLRFLSFFSLQCFRVVTFKDVAAFVELCRSHMRKCANYESWSGTIAAIQVQQPAQLKAQNIPMQ